MTATADDRSLSAAAAAGAPSLPGPGYAPGNIELTATQTDPGSIGGGTAARPERLLVIARHEAGDASTSAVAHYLFARWADWPHPTLLALGTPTLDERLTDAVGRLLWARLGVQATDEPRLGPERLPVRMPHPRTGVEGLGWLRAVAVSVRGEVTPDALLDGFARLTADEAHDGLSTAVERSVFAAGVALFD